MPNTIAVVTDDFEFAIDPHGISAFNTRVWHGSSEYYTEQGEKRIHAPDRAFISESLAATMQAIASIIEESA